MIRRRQKQGYFLVAVVMLVVVFSLLSTCIAHMFTSMTVISSDQINSSQSFYIAETGLEHARQALLDPVLTSRLICSNASITNADASIGDGSFQLTASTETVGGIATVTTSVLTTDTNIFTSNGTLFPSHGRVMIDKEVIDYQRVRGNVLVGATVSNTRGQDVSAISAHAVGARIGMFQCHINSVGNVTTGIYMGQRDVSNNVQLQAAWAVGNNGHFTTFNVPTQNTWNTSSGTPNRRMNAVSMLNYFDGWAVGDNQGSQATIRRWNPNTLTWNVVAFSLNRDLDGVSAVSSTDVWAVGQRSGSSYNILHYNGSNWCVIQAFPSVACHGKNYQSTVANSLRNLTAVSAVDTTGSGTSNVGFVVGGSNSTGHTMSYNGTTWSDQAPPGFLGTLYGVKVISSTEAWAVGRLSSSLSNPFRNWGGIIRWNGTTWTLVAIADTYLRGIDVIDTDGDGSADIGWAVGDSGRALIYNGTVWTRQDIPINQTFYGVSILGDSDDAWAVGNGGRRVHWDGTSWTLITSTGQTLRGIDSVSAKIRPNSGWREDFA